MGRPPALSVETKVRIVLDILEARTTIVQAARVHHVSETAIGNWKRQFIDSGRIGLQPGRSAESSAREVELEAEIASLRTALEDATILVRVWRMSAESRLGPSRTSR